MSWRVESSVLDEGGSAELLQDRFKNNFRDMFLNITQITYYMHAPFWVSFNLLLVNSCPNWPRHFIRIVYFALWYETIMATAGAGTFVHAGAWATSTGPFPWSVRTHTHPPTHTHTHTQTYTHTHTHTHTFIIEFSGLVNSNFVTNDSTFLVHF